jgi:UDP-glucose 4-epimerase
MNILITGGAGYIGTELVKTLIVNESVQKITVYDNLSRPNHNFFLGHTLPNAQKVKFVNGDLLDSRKLKKNLEGIDVVFHLAAKVTTPFANTDAHYFEQVNHWGTAELVYAVEESNVKKFIFTSSTSIYGAASKSVNEETIPNPRTFYGISKLRAEDHVKRLFPKMSTYILRCGNVYGYSRSMRFDAVINKFMFEANFNRRISIHGNGKQARAFIHVDALTDILQKLAFEQVNSGVYNVLSRNLDILDIVDVLKEIYPDLEFIFINQHLDLRELKVSEESRLREFINFPQVKDLKEELLLFKEKFSF